MSEAVSPHETDDRFHDECGVVGVWDHPGAVELVKLGLHALQHRGQDGAGVLAWDGETMSAHRGAGLVADVFGRRVSPVQGARAIGHVRYGTAGGQSLANIQPLCVAAAGTHIGIAHNGNLVNAPALRAELAADGAIFQTTSDTELIVHLMARSRQKALLNKTVEALGRVSGAWSLLFLTPEHMIAARDPMGFRPLVLGRMPGGAWVAASETCALDLLEATYVRDVEPGELVIIEDSGITSFFPFPAAPRHQCVFEHVYFARPDTKLWGREVYPARVRLGRRLAMEHPADADLVIPVPDSGTSAAIGYAGQLGLPFELGLMRNHYVGRSFIQPSQQDRDLKVRMKLNPVKGLLQGKRVVVVDDSIVRGTTCRKIVRLLKAAGVAEVHLRIAAPPTTGPCFYGIDTPSRDALIAASKSVDAIGRYVGADSIGYISIEGMHEAVHEGEDGYCDACFSGRYPLLPEEAPRPQLGLFD